MGEVTENGHSDLTVNAGKEKQVDSGDNKIL